MTSAQIFGVKIDKKTKREVDLLLLRVLKKGKKFTAKPLSVATLNPEILLKAKGDDLFRKTLNKFDLNIVDGFGIVLCSLFRLKRLYRYPGADLAGYLLNNAVRLNLKTVLILKEGGLSTKKELEKYLLETFGKKGLKLVQVLSERELGDDYVLVSKKSHLALVGLGAPKQEYLVQELVDKRPNLRILVGVGGTFDYWTKNQKRPPKFVIKVGFEWFWRLVMLKNYSNRGGRVNRIIKAVIVFPFKYFFSSSRVKQ